MAVVAIGEAGEALLVRSILENLGAAVLLHLIGTPDDFLRVIEQGEAAPRYMVICGHGDANGFVFGDYGDEIDMTSLVRGTMPPRAIADRARLPGVIVVSTACATGSSAFAEAFFAGGAAAYIASPGYPQRDATGVFIHLLFHQLLINGASPAAALRRAQGYDPDFDMFRLFCLDNPGGLTAR